MNITYVNNQQQLAQACDLFKHSRFICIDTEFHRESTYYAELALIQLADEQHTVCIDPLTVTDLSPFLALMTDENILKVFHAPGQDLEIFNHDFSILPVPVFDTQIAATLLGYGEQIGYATLISTCLNINLDKSQTRTDWMKRPLSQQQIEYAANDVIYLAQVFPLMEQQLTALNRLEWLQDDFDALSVSSNYVNDPQQMWRKAKGNQRLRGQQLATLQAVAAWRETTAQQRNKPRRRILPDDALIDIAHQKPRTGQQLKGLRALTKTRLSEDDIDQIIACIEHSLELPKEQWPSLPKKQKLKPNEDALIDVLSAVLKLNANQHNINHTIMANRKQLEALVRGERDLPILSGWRKSHGGQMLLDFIEGKLSLSTQTGQLVIQ